MTAALFAVAAHADVLYATGFEASEGYNLGAEVTGLNGWQAVVPSTAQQHSFVITQDAGFSGAQSLAFNPVGPSGQFLVYHTVTPPSVSGATVTIDTAFGTSDSGTRSSWDPIVAYTAAGSFIAQIGFGQNGHVVLGLASSAVDLGIVMDKGFWGQYEMVLDFHAHTVSASFNGQSIGSGPIGTTITGLGIFIAGINDAQGGTEIGYLDAVRIITAVPEPASYALFGVGLAAVLALARRRSAR